MPVTADVAAACRSRAALRPYATSSARCAQRSASGTAIAMELARAALAPEANAKLRRLLNAAVLGLGKPGRRGGFVRASPWQQPVQGARASVGHEDSARSARWVRVQLS